MANELILAVDDEAHILELLSFNLEASGYRVVTAATGEDALVVCAQERPAMILLDIMLPGIDGVEVCRRLKSTSTTADIPIIMLTAKGDEVDKILGLEIGADDYVTKPFSPRELVARVRAVLRRSTGEPAKTGEVYRFNHIVFDTQAHLLSVDGREESLTPIEYDLLYHFIQHRNRACSRLQLMDAAGLGAFEGAERTIDVHIHNLRKKIERDPANPEMILTVFGTGYRFIADLERV